MKLTAQEIDERSMRAMEAYQNALEAGEIDQDAYDQSVKDLAQWSIAQYSKLPQAQALGALLEMLRDIEKAKR